MKKNISINIGGIIFHIEEDGYDQLKNYLDSVNTYFSSFDDSKEIIDDIENRIAEIFLARLDDGKQIISKEDVAELINIMGTTKDFDATIDSEEKEPEHKDEKEPEAERGQEKKTKKLYRDTSRNLIGGVAAGFANYFRLDPIWVRLIILFLILVPIFPPLNGAIFIGYIVFWIALPGSNTLEEDNSIKKLYRDGENHVLGGVCSGLALYFGSDRSLIRILFVVSMFFGAGILLYIILWIIIPEAKTITEKMEMQGEPVTISNIEESVKKRLNVKEEEEENPLVKILLFPFRLIALIFEALGKSLGPLLKFAVEILRIAAGGILVLVGFCMILCFTVAAVVLLGFGGALQDAVQMGAFPTEYLMETLSTLSTIAIYVVTIIPALAVLMLGLSVILKRSVLKPYMGWSMFGLWVLSAIVLAFSIPAFITDFRTENNYKEEIRFEANESITTLKLNDIEPNYQLNYDEVRLRLRGHRDSAYLLVLDYESRGISRKRAKENAQKVKYNVKKEAAGFLFDSHLSFNEGAPFRFQNVYATLYIPYGQTFRMEEGLSEILRNTLNRNGYSKYQMEGNDWVFNDEGIICTTCEENSAKGKSRKNRNSDTQSFDFDDFDEVIITALFDFEIRQGNSYEVLIEGDPDELKDISLVQNGDELKISYDMDWKWISERGKKRIKLFIEMPELEYLGIKGACEGSVEGFSNDEMEFKIEGASSLKADIQTEDLNLDLIGASNMRLEGKGSNMEVDIAGASELKAFDFITNEAEVNVAGASSAKIHVLSNLEANAAGVSSIKYRGNPSISSNSVGFSSIKKD